MNRSERIWQAFAGFAASVMKIFPRRWRYPLAFRMSRWSAWIVSPLLMRRPHRLQWTTPLDETLRSALRTMSRRGIEFDPQYRTDVPADLVDVVCANGALVAGVHMPLNALAVFYLHSIGCSPIAVQGGAHGDRIIWGTNEPIEALFPNPAILLQMRQKLRERHAIVMVLDRGGPEDGTVPIDTPAGETYVVTALFDFAKRLRVPFYWLAVRTAADGVPVVQIKPIEPELEAFATEFRSHIEAVRRRPPEVTPAGTRP